MLNGRLKRVLALALCGCLMCGCSTGKGLFADEVENSGNVMTPYDAIENVPPYIEITEEVLASHLRSMPKEFQEFVSGMTYQEMRDTPASVYLERDKSQPSKPNIMGRGADAVDNIVNPKLSVSDSPRVVSPEEDSDVTASFTDHWFAYEIRMRCGLEMNAPIMQSDCDKITELSFTLSLADLVFGTFTNLDGIENFRNLESLTIDSIELDSTEFCLGDYPTLANLKYLQLMGMGLTDIDLHGFSNLLLLNVSDNELKSLDISPCKKLTNVYAKGNKIEEVAKIKSKNMIAIAFEGLQCLDMDLSGMPNLQYVEINYSNLERVNLSGLKQLWYLDLHNNIMESISLKDNKKLNYLNLSSNSFEELSISKLPELASLNVADNSFLTNLSVKNCKNLQYMECNKCHLQKLNVDGCTSLGTLIANDNYLRRLDLSSCNIQELDVRKNCFNGKRHIKGVKISDDNYKYALQRQLTKNKMKVEYQYIGITKGKTAAIKVLKAPKNGSLSFKSNKPDIVSVSKLGKLTAKKPGKAVITVTSDGGLMHREKSEKVFVKVYKKGLNKVKNVEAVRSGKKVEASWGKYKGAKRYEIKYAYGEKTVTKSVSARSFTVSTPKAVSIQVRAIVKNGDYVRYTPWSKWVKVKKK